MFLLIEKLQEGKLIALFICVDRDHGAHGRCGKLPGAVLELSTLQHQVKPRSWQQL